MQKSVVRHPIGKTRPTDSNVFQKAQIHHLMFYQFRVELRRRFVFVRFYASDVMRSLGLQIFHQCTHGIFEDRTGGRWPFCHLFNVFHAIRPHFVQQRIFAVKKTSFNCSGEGRGGRGEERRKRGRARLWIHRQKLQISKYRKKNSG